MKPNDSKNIKWYWVIVGACLILLLIIGITLPQLILVQAKPIPTPAKSTDPLIQILQTQIQNGKTDNNDRQVLETRVGVLSSNATIEALALEKLPHYRSTIIRTVTVAAPLDANRLTGIIDGPAIPFSPMTYLIENAWQGKINNEYVTVFAGAGRKDPEQGILIIETENPPKFKIINTLQKSGSVKIVDFKGFQLVLQSANKDVIYFDIPSQQFIMKLGEIVPIVTKIPSQKATNEPLLGTLTPTLPPYP